jgi:hypothetical protein
LQRQDLDQAPQDRQKGTSASRFRYVKFACLELW